MKARVPSADKKIVNLRHALQVKKSTNERRLETRFEFTEPVKVTLLGDEERSCWGQTLNVSASGMSFSVPIALPIGSLVKLEVPDGMVLGEVRHCRPGGDPAKEYAIGLSIEHILFGWMEFYEKARAVEIVSGELERLDGTPAVTNASPR
jgi:hypothetical protein